MMIHMQLPHMRKEMAQEFSLYAGLEHLSAERRSQKAEKTATESKKTNQHKAASMRLREGSAKISTAPA